MFHDLCNLISNHPDGSFIIILALIAAFFYLVKAFIERNKPVCECECYEEEEEEEVVAMGGEEEDVHHEDR